MWMTVLLPLLLALLAAPVTVLAGLLRPVWAAPIGAAMAGLAFGATLWGWIAGGGTIEIAWAPTWNLHLSFTLDGLAALYALLATGIGFAVVVYSSKYIPLHLEEEGRPGDEQARFYGFLLLFMGSMVGLVMAQDLLLAFIFWDLTAITSYYLIGYDREQAEARDAALMAMLITGISAVCFLIGAILLFNQYGTFSIPNLIMQAEPGSMLTTASALIAVAALAKSAQVPFHFWLPRAMAAPTPVSAYLHSAAMVAAGVFLLMRIYPLLQASELLLDVLLGIGLLSMAVGGVLALTRDVLKQVLAYSTIAQYGYIVTMLGLNGKIGVGGAAFYVIAHALAKSSLFLTAGAVTEATEQDRLSQLGGLWRSLPLLATASGVAAAGLAALPLTIGFFKDELFFEAALERGWPFAALAVIGAALTLAYIWRFWSNIFLGPERAEAHHIPVALVVPIVVLGLLIVLGGIMTAPFERLAETASVVILGELAPIDLAYHFDARPENLLALATYVLGTLIIISRPAWVAGAAAVARLGERVGPEQWYKRMFSGLSRISDYSYSMEVRDLRGRISTILVPGAILVGAGLAVTRMGVPAPYVVGAIQVSDIPLLSTLLLAAIAALFTAQPRNHLTLVLALSTVGYSLAAVFAFFGGPDVALVAVLVETILTLLFLGILALFPPDALQREEQQPTQRSFRWRDPLVGVVAGAAAFIVAWGAFSQPGSPESMALKQAQLTPAAHAKDIVTAILADFRGLDTMGEITVVAIALLGVTRLLRPGRARK